MAPSTGERHGDDMAHRAAQRLVGRDVRLRGLRDADLPSLVDWSLHPDVMTPLWARSAANAESAQRAYYAKWGTAVDGTSVAFAIERREPETLVGAVTIAAKGLRQAQVAIFLDPAAHGHGYGTQALQLATTFGFGEMQLHRIEATIMASNEASKGAFARAGFVTEGRHRHVVNIGGEWVDEIVVSRIEGLDD